MAGRPRKNQPKQNQYNPEDDSGWIDYSAPDKGWGDEIQEILGEIENDDSQDR